MAQPSESDILCALAEYRKHVLDHNRKVFAQLVHLAETEEAPSDYDEEDAAERRREFMWDQLCVTRPSRLAADDPRRIDVPDDVSELALDGTVVQPDQELRAVSRVQYRAGIEAGLKDIGGEAAQLQLPADFSILMEPVDGLVGPGERTDAVAERFWNGLDAFKEKAGEDSWEVLAAWECGIGPDATCFVVYFRDSQDSERKNWCWRYVVQFGPSADVFDNIVVLLNWYTTRNEPVLQNIDLTSGRVFG